MNTKKNLPVRATEVTVVTVATSVLGFVETPTRDLVELRFADMTSTNQLHDHVSTLPPLPPQTNKSPKICLGPFKMVITWYVFAMESNR